MSDPIGHQTLEIMREANYYNKWVLDLILPSIHGKVAEVGSGIGSFAGVLSKKYEVTAIDFNREYLNVIKKNFPTVETFEFDLQSPQVSSALQGSFDTVIAINVLEHLPNLSLALEHIAKMLKPQGRLTVIVPAFQFAYGTLDKNLGHYRRYTKKQFNTYLKRSGLTSVYSRYINFWSLFGWLVNGRLLKRPIIPKFQVRLFDLLFRPWMEMEKFVKFPLGLSLVCIAEKK